MSMTDPKTHIETAPQHWFSGSRWSPHLETPFKVHLPFCVIKLPRSGPWPTVKNTCKMTTRCAFVGKKKFMKYFRTQLRLQQYLRPVLRTHDTFTSKMTENKMIVDFRCCSLIPRQDRPHKVYIMGSILKTY